LRYNGLDWTGGPAMATEPLEQQYEGSGLLDAGVG
jgi:hypothetical protein